MSQKRNCLQDVAASIGALQAEKLGLEGRVQQAAEYIQSVAAQRDRHLAEAERVSERRDHLPSLLARLASSPDSPGSENSDAASIPSSALSVPSEPCSGTRFHIGSKFIATVIPRTFRLLAADERLLLMQDVEALYREAVAVQEGLVRKKQHLENQRIAAQTLLDQRRLVAQQLDAQVDALEAERARAELTLRCCQSSLEESLARVAEQVILPQIFSGWLNVTNNLVHSQQTKGHEAELTCLENEETALKERLVRLAEQERTLAERVDELQAQREQRGLHSTSTHFSATRAASLTASSGPRSLGQREVLAADHLSRTSGAAGTFLRARGGKTSVTDICNLSGKVCVKSLLLSEDKLGVSVGAVGVGMGKENKRMPQCTKTTSSAPKQANSASRKTSRPPTGRESVKTSVLPSSPLSVAVRASSASTQAPQDGDIDKQIEALSLRIRQRLTNV